MFSLRFVVSSSTFGLVFSTMDSALDRLDAAVFIQTWQHFDVDGNKTLNVIYYI